MKNKQEKVEFENCQVLKETDKAIQVKFSDRVKLEWIPKSQIDEDSEVWVDGDAGKLVLSEWICKEKGLI